MCRDALFVVQEIARSDWRDPPRVLRSRCLALEQTYADLQSLPDWKRERFLPLSSDRSGGQLVPHTSSIDSRMTAALLS